MGICHIIGAGDFFKEDLKADENDLLIAADRGLLYLEAEPDIIVGDFDSLGFIPQGKKVITLQPKKDESDIFMCIQEGLRRGYRDFRLYGAWGGERFDHTIANMQLLLWLYNRGCGAVLYTKNQKLLVCRHAALEPCPGYVSIFAFEKSKVELSGFVYSGIFDFSPEFPLGLSNETVGRAEIHADVPVLVVTEKTAVLRCR